MTENKNYTAEKLGLDMANKLGSLGAMIEDLTHVEGVISRMAVDAKDKYTGKLEPYFLWDNNDTLQTVTNLMFRLLKEINKEYKEIDDMQSQLRELMKVGKLDTKKAQSAATE